MTTTRKAAANRRESLASADHLIELCENLRITMRFASTIAVCGNSMLQEPRAFPAKLSPPCRSFFSRAALDQDKQVRLFMVAQSNPKYRWTYFLLVLCHYCGMHPCESLELRWRDINWQKKFLTIMRSNTPAGWRYPSLNETCLGALQMLLDQATLLRIAEPEHYVFPYHPRGRFRKNQPPLDPTRPMTKYARQWNEILKEAGLEGSWFYDGRRRAFSQMQEAGLPVATSAPRSGISRPRS